MKLWIKTLVVALVFGIVVADAASAQRRRQEKRKEAQAEETQKQPAGLSAVDDAALVAALGLFVYPAGGQGTEQQQADEAECAAWARQQSGEMPTSLPEEGAAEDQGSRREERRDGDRSALKGAAKGAVIGEALDDDEPNRPGGKGNKDLDDIDRPDSRDDVGDNVKRAKKDDDPSGAAVGAAVGAVAGRRRGKKAEAKAEAQAAEVELAGKEQAERDNLSKGMKVCLEAKGYEVE